MMVKELIRRLEERDQDAQLWVREDGECLGIEGYPEDWGYIYLGRAPEEEENNR